MVFCFHASQGGVDVAFTDRHGGASLALYESLNLREASADKPEAVERNYATVAAACGVDPGRVARMHQVHGTDVAVLREAPAPDRLPRVDGLVTDVAGLVLSVRVADCVPVLLADATAGVVGCAHAGRAGLAAGVVAAAVAAMRASGAGELTAWVGPHVCGRCYEVPAALQEEVADLVPAARATTSWGTPSLDLGAGVGAQLEALGCTVASTPQLCTRESADLYSHRREGAETGRNAGLVWVRE